MVDMHGIVVTPWSRIDELASLVAAYHLTTEREKGHPVEHVTDLPERYRQEITDPTTAFAGSVVLVARSRHATVGCVVLTAPRAGRVELKRLWVDPDNRGRGVARALTEAALERARLVGAQVVRLSVWRWRAGAVALYERLGFTVVESWDPRDGLVCMERVV